MNFKFRSYNKMANEFSFFADGRFDFFDKESGIVFPLKKGSIYITPSEIDLWTGIKDSEGVDIYGGDIISAPSSDGSLIRHAVLWDDDNCCFEASNVDFPAIRGGSISKQWVNTFVFKVTGNIYQNDDGTAK